MLRLEPLTNLDGPFRFLRRPGAWLWAVAAVGGLIRIYLVVFTEGTLDVLVWDGHAEEIRSKGLVGYYHGGRYQFNHPPLMGRIFAAAQVVAESTGIPFKVFLRLPFAVLDAGTAVLLYQLVRPHAYRFLLPALYWIHPLALIFSSYHGNTDSGIAFFIVGSTLLVARGHPVAAGAMLGMGLWVKVPAVLALPALLAALPSWKARGQMAGAWGAVGGLAYLPTLIEDAQVLVNSVFLYSGLSIQTQARVKIWGVQNFYPSPASVPDGFRSYYVALINGYYRFNTLVALIPICIVAWCRRHDRGGVAIGSNVARSYIILNGLTNFWAWQYLAWALPLWLLMGWRYALAASLFATAYVYGLYAWLCGNPFLLGPWEFIAKRHWPAPIVGLRDAATLFFFFSAWAILIRALRKTRGRETDSEREAGDAV